MFLDNNNVQTGGTISGDGMMSWTLTWNETGLIGIEWTIKGYIDVNDFLEKTDNIARANIAADIHNTNPGCATFEIINEQ